MGYLDSMKKLLSVTLSILFIVSCGGGGGGSTPTPVPTVNLSADPTSVLLTNTSTLTWSSTNATSCSATWTSQTGTSGSEAVTISAAGNNNFSITCTGEGGSGSASVTVEGYRNTDGVVVDGYISGAEVCIDEDESWTCDSNENSTTSDNDGKFTIRYANGNLVSIGGTDLDSQALLDNLLITHKLTGHTDFKTITPVTSVAAFMTDASNVNAALGIDPNIDIFTFDPVANMGDGGVNDYLYVLGNRLTVFAFSLQNAINEIKSSTDLTQDYFKAISEEIEKEYTRTSSKVDITDNNFIWAVMDNVTAAKSVTYSDDMQDDYIKSGISAILPVIDIKSTPDLTSAVIRFSFTRFQENIRILAKGGQAADDLDGLLTFNILDYIANDQDINADDITPNITAIDDTVSTNEDTHVDTSVIQNDNFLNSAPITITSGAASNGTTEVRDCCTIRYTPSSDFNGTDSFNYNLLQGGKTATAKVTVTIIPVNDPPSIDIASTIQVAENQTAVTTVSVSDVDEDELTLTLGGTDASSFNLSSDNVLSFKEAPDFETKSSYSITLSLTDGTETVTKDISVTVTNVNDIAPVFTSEATFSAAENQTAIGTVTATDADGDGIAYSISGSEITINSSSGVIAFASAPDYETKASYTATVTASDGVNTTTQDITVNVTNVNDNSPSFTSSATFSADENQTAIGTVAASDADGDTITYSISGSDITINSSSGVFAFASAPDYETNSIYTATVTASDGTNSTAQNITINVTNVNECSVGVEESYLTSKLVCSLSGIITEDSILSDPDTNLYKLNGKVSVGVDMGGDGTKSGGVSATLTIEPGVTIFGESGNDYLLVNRGSKIDAVGTASSPITMTGKQDILGDANIETTRGLWGGIIILGQAPINNCSDDVRGTATCERVVEGSDALMGGATLDDNSGRLKYLRILYAGYEVFPGNELNGITFGAVGSGTEVDYVQIHNNQDDCVEFFGGTVNVKHLICTNAGDDGLDFDWGYQGKMQHVIVTQPDNFGDHIVESDNTNANGNGAYDTEPITKPIVSNFTFIASENDEAIQLKEGTDGRYYNGVIYSSDSSQECFEIQNTVEDARFNSVAMDCGGFVVGDSGVVTAGSNNLYGANSGGGSYASSLNGVINGVNENNATVSNALASDSFFDVVDYIGAVKDSSSAWYSGWTLENSLN